MSCLDESILPKPVASGTCTFVTMVEHKEYRAVLTGINAAYVARNGLWARGQVHNTSGRRPLYSQTKVEKKPTEGQSDQCHPTSTVTETVNKAYL